MTENKELIHFATLADPKKLLLLFKEGEVFSWKLLEGDQETETPYRADSLEKALQMVQKPYQEQGISLLTSGYLFTLPERDEHGTPALFSEMKASLASMNGVFFDSRRGHLCIVHQIPSKAREFLKTLRANLALKANT